MLTCLCWKWGPLFSADYVNRLQSMLARHLHIPHELVCVTDDQNGINPSIHCEPLTQFTDTPRCRRRMLQYSEAFVSRFGSRILSIDLDVVIVDDLTPAVDRPEPVVCWCVGYACVYSGSFVLYDAGALDGLWRLFAADPEGFPRKVQPRGVPSDQAMLNHYLRGMNVAHWTEADGFVTWFGDGYAKLEKHSMGPSRIDLPPGARIVVLGSADKAVLDDGQYAFVREHWRS